jgi:hypothetical protein
MAKTGLIILFVVIFLIIVGVSIYFLTKSDSKKDDSKKDDSKKDDSKKDDSKKDDSKKDDSNKESEDKKKKELEDKKKKEQEDKDLEDKKKKEQEERDKKKNLARYIRIQRVDNTNNVINLNELIVLDKNNKNVALSKNGSTITAISQHSPDRAPSMLIDDDNYSNAHTAGDSSVHWYEIDLGSQVEIKKIIIVNRKDCCSDRAKGLQVQLYKDPSSNTSRTIISKADITTDKPTYAWTLDDTGFKEDLTLDLPWQCVGDINVPLRRNINNDVECMSQNNRDCLWKNNKTECESLLTNKPNDIKPLECGDMHNRVWGSPAYNVPNHWCAKAKNFI